MARNMYGATSADFTLTSGGRVIPGAVLTLWSARTGGTQITDLTDVGGTAITSVTSGADGSVVYYGPDADKDTHWAQASQGSRIAIRPVNITGETGATPALTVGTVTTGTAAATLTGTDEDPVLNLTIPPAGANGVNTAAIQDGAVTAAKIGALTTKGDLLARDGSGAVRLPVGTDGQVLVADAAASAGVKWGAEPAVKATVGNLLTDNQASGTDTLGDTTGFSTTVNCSLASSPAQSHRGLRSLAVTSVAAGATVVYPANANAIPPTAVPVTAGETITAMLHARSAAVTSTAKVRLHWYKSDGAASAVSAVVSGTDIALSTSAWTGHTVTAVAPPDAAYATLSFIWTAAAGAEVVYLDGLSIHRGAGGTWAMPGAPIVGMSEVASNGAVHLSGTGAPEGVVSAAPGSTYLQVSGAATVTGMMSWRKTSGGTGSTGWSPEGALADTGWRDVSASLDASFLSANPNADLKVRRVGDTVRAVFRRGGSGTTTGSVTIWTAPAGFVIKIPGNASAVCMNGGGAGYGPTSEGAFVSSSAYKTGNWSASTQYWFDLSYNTPDAWPSSLPGSAA